MFDEQVKGQNDRKDVNFEAEFCQLWGNSSRFSGDPGYNSFFPMLWQDFRCLGSPLLVLTGSS